MKKHFFVILLVFISLGSFAVDTFYKYIHSKEQVSLLEFKDNSLKEVISSLFEKEKRCKYYSDSLMISIRISSYPNDSCTIKRYYLLLLETGVSKYTFIHLKPAGVFCINRHLCFVYGETPTRMFIKTNRKLNVNYRKPVYRKLKKGEIPRICKEDEIDDSYSQWLYSYCNNGFKMVEEHQFCDVWNKNTNPH